MSEHQGLASRDLPRRAFIATFWSFFFALCSIYGLILAFYPRTYSSEASVEILPSTTNIQLRTESQSTKRRPQWISTELEFIQSPTVLKMVIEELDLNERWGKIYNIGGSAFSTKESFNMLTGRIEVRMFRRTPVIKITYFSDRAAETEEIVTAIVRSYRDSIVLEHHGVSVRILASARTPTKATSPNIPLGIAWGFLRSVVFALLAATIARGLVIKIRDLPPPLPRDKPVPRFQKY